MTRRAPLALAVLALTATSAGAQWRDNGKKIHETEWMKHKGKLAAQLGFTDKPDEFFAAWEKPTPGVEISSTDTAQRGVPIVAVIIFTGCKPDDRGMCNATVRYTASRPDGKMEGQPQDGELWVNKPAPAENTLQLAVGNLGVVIDPGDPLGKWTVEAVITDHNAKTTLTLRRNFNAVEKNKN